MANITNMSWQTIFAVGSGGFLGAVSRVYMIGVVNRLFPHHLPLGTSGVNLVGSFIIGVLFAYFTFNEVSPNVKSFLTSGFLGALTTYSTFAIESYFLLNTNMTLAILNVVFNVIGTILFATFGYKLVIYLLG
jgi:CrcB protein